MLKYIRCKLKITKWHVMYSTFFFKLELYLLRRTISTLVQPTSGTVHRNYSLDIAYAIDPANNSTTP